MIQAILKGRDIEVTADDAGDIHIAGQLTGATRNAKMPPRTWIAPFTLDNIQALRAAGALASSALIRAANQAEGTARYVEEMKQAERVEPMRPVPIREGVTLYNHQIKAFNIALALFGYKVKGGGVQ